MADQDPVARPVDWFRCRPSDLLAEIAAMRPHEGLTYLTLLFCVQMEAGPVQEDARTISRRTGLRRSLVANALAVLVEAGVVTIMDDGRLDMPESHEEIAWRHSRAARFLSAPRSYHRSTPPRWQAIRRAVFERDGFVCAYCGTTEPPFEIDHIEARTRGGSDDPENLCVACGPCNRGKNDRSAEQWLAVLASRSTTDALKPPPGGAK